MTTPTYDVDYFIRKFSAIPDERWCVQSYMRDNHRYCALGHCGVRDAILWTDEGLALADLFGGRDDGGAEVATINDGNDMRYRQQLARARILAALHDIKARAEQALDDYERRPLLSVQKPQQKEELCVQL